MNMDVPNVCIYACKAYGTCMNMDVSNVSIYAFKPQDDSWHACEKNVWQFMHVFVFMYLCM
jgi:hypothetical protein